MCGRMVDIQSPTAEIRRGKKEEETTGWPALLHRVAINNTRMHDTIWACRTHRTAWAGAMAMPLS